MRCEMETFENKTTTKMTLKSICSESNKATTKKEIRCQRQIIYIYTHTHIKIYTSDVYKLCMDKICIYF